MTPHPAPDPHVARRDDAWRDDDARVAPELARVRAVARALDTALRVPGTDIRFGADAVLGLVPGLGDLAGTVLSGYIVLAAARLGAPPAVLARMLLNLGIDTAAGVVPVVGDLFDVGWRANVRNAALLERHVAAPAEVRRASRATLALVALAFALLAGAALTAAYFTVRGLLALLS